MPCAFCRGDFLSNFPINEIDYEVDNLGAIHHNSHIVQTWTEALELIRRYPWPNLRPLIAHPDFQPLLWEEVQKHNLSKRRMKDWEEICTIM